MRYALALRPLSLVTLPEGITHYDVVALPWDSAHYNRPDLKVSEHYRYGEFTTNRPLTAEEIEHFDVIEIPEENV